MLHSSGPAAGNDEYFELGIRDGITLMFAKVNEGVNGYTNKIKTIGLPINLHLTTEVSFLKYFKLDFRIGVLNLYEDFSGLDEGIFLEANLFRSDFYGTAGLVFFNIGETGHGVTHYSESGGSGKFLSMGLGYHISRHVDLDLTYYLPFNKV